jgi:hypothetical protein
MSAEIAPQAVSLNDKEVLRTRFNQQSEISNSPFPFFPRAYNLRV